MILKQESEIMKKIIAVLIVVLVCGSAYCGEVGLPLERIALPSVSGSHLICVWDASSETWLKSFEAYDQSGAYEFQVPAWGKWYWIGLWDEATGEYVFGKWIGHFIIK